jgi:hypothetical protein
MKRVLRLAAAFARSLVEHHRQRVYFTKVGSLRTFVRKTQLVQKICLELVANETVT